MRSIFSVWAEMRDIRPSLPDLRAARQARTAVRLQAGRPGGNLPARMTKGKVLTIALSIGLMGIG